METSLQAIFNEIQTCDSKRFSENLALALGIIPKNNNFLNIINSILICQKSAIPPKISHFIKRIFEELYKDNEAILQAILLYLSDRISCKTARVRKNAIKLMAAIIHIYKDSPSSTEQRNIIIKITEALFDKDQGVRKEAMKVCILHQNFPINDNLTVQCTLKDSIRYDQSHEIRKIGFSGLEINKSTVNCILERCLDVNTNIRRIFWISHFPLINLENISKAQRIYLLKAAFTEREFDAKSSFVKKATEIGFPGASRYFFCQEPEYEVFITLYLKSTDITLTLSEYTPWHLNSMFLYYKLKEESDGRDSLNLIPIEEYLSILYSKCSELELLISDSASSEEISYAKISVKYLFKLLTFYDIFIDSVKKQIFSIIRDLMIKSNVAEIVEESVILSKRICDDNIVPFLGSIIKKTKGSSICYLICENVLKHIPFGAMHDAILNEIAMLNLGQSINLVFWYFLNKPSENLQNLYLSFLPNIKAVEGATDLVLAEILDISHLEECLLSQISKSNENFVIPITKLLLARKIEDAVFVKYLLFIFYNSKTESIEQYLSLFFYEFFKNYPSFLVQTFCDVLEKIEVNQRIFIDQSLYWLSNCPTKLPLQELFYVICLFILNNYENLKNKKYHFFTIEKIAVEASWEPVCTKKIIYLIGAINRKRPRENISGLLAKLMEIDDGSPMSNEDFQDLKSEITDQ